MNAKEKYAVEWNESAQFFYDHNSYKHLVTHINGFNKVLEIDFDHHYILLSDKQVHN